MQSLKISSVLLLSCLAFTGKVCAQTIERTVLASDGGNFQGTAQSISWTIGEPCTETLFGGGRMLTQGFQQPQLKISSSFIETYSEQEGQLFVYPNPVEQFLNLSFEDLPTGNYVSELYDLRGALIQSFRLQVAENTQTFLLDLGQLQNAEYILRVRATDHGFTKSIKIFHLNPY